MIAITCHSRNKASCYFHIECKCKCSLSGMSCHSALEKLLKVGKHQFFNRCLDSNCATNSAFLSLINFLVCNELLFEWSCRNILYILQYILTIYSIYRVNKLPESYCKNDKLLKKLQAILTTYRKMQ